jgi:pilus assembly protein CpaE
MISSLELLAIGPAADFVHEVVAALAKHAMVRITAARIENGHLRALSKSGELGQPDAILLCMSPGSTADFRAVVGDLPRPLPLLFAISAEHDLELLREAMRLGARDFFERPVQTEQLIADIQKFVHQEHERRHQQDSSTRLTAFINAKGGSGASFIAANTAMEMAKTMPVPEGKQPQLLLMDMDFQFGGLPIYLGLHAGDGLIKALQSADSLDATALRGYVQKHDIGLHLLAAAMDHIMLPDAIDDERITQLLSVVATSYRQLVVDLPRRIDTAMATLIHHADTVAVVTQQSVAHLHDAKRLMFLLHERIGVDAQRIMLLLNRYDKKRDVRAEDYANSFPEVRIETLPSDYVQASESINLGVGICDIAPRSPLGKGMVNLTNKLLVTDDVPTQVQTDKGLFGWLRPGKS